MSHSIYPTGNSKFISRLNKIKILNLIRENDQICRADVAKRIGLSPPTVSRAVNDLIKDNLVIEVGKGISRGGKRPTRLSFSGEDNYIIGIDLGTTNIKGVLSDLNANIIEEVKQPTLVGDGFDAVMGRTSEVIQKLKNNKSRNGKKIHGIGIAVAGLINLRRNFVEFSPNFHWHNVDVLRALTQNFDIPITFDNVTRVMALGELCYGIGKKIKNFICVNVGYGIGAGIIIDGKPLFGPLGISGEFGHITVDKDSKIQCDCGNYGCLEALSSGNAISKIAQNELRKGAKSILMDICKGEISKVDAEMVANAAKKGDDFARDIFDKAVEYLGVGISNLINIFSPEAVLIGGGVAQAGDILFDKMRKTIEARALHIISEDLIIKPMTFGMKSAVMGAISLILREIINPYFSERSKFYEPNRNMRI